jgi:hypothetical protein
MRYSAYSTRVEPVYFFPSQSFHAAPDWFMRELLPDAIGVQAGSLFTIGTQLTSPGSFFAAL